ncbi:MAG TPA: hypothetical protein VKX16_17930 [Chloroflexota bacterium]|nr:hypothetical protein [Chloroflexota bacterium]
MKSLSLPLAAAAALGFASIPPALAFPPAGPGVAPAARACHGQPICRCRPYTGKCRILAIGPFTVTVPGSTVRLHGRSTARTAGTAVAVERVSLPHLKRGELAFKVFASGTLPPLKVVGKARLYRLDVATNRWHRVHEITGTGIFKVLRA